MPRRRNKKKVEIHLKDHLAAALYDVKGNSSNAAATVSLVAPTKRASTPSEASSKKKSEISKFSYFVLFFALD